MCDSGRIVKAFCSLKYHIHYLPYVTNEIYDRMHAYVFAVVDLPPRFSPLKVRWDDKVPNAWLVIKVVIVISAGGQALILQTITASFPIVSV